MKKSFVMYQSWAPLFINLKKEDAGELIQSIFAYQKEGIEPDETEYIFPMFQMIKATMKDDAEKYKETCERRAESGSKGGQAKGSKSKQKLAKIANASKSKQMLANQAESDNDSDNDSDSESEYESEYDSESENEEQVLSFSNENDCRAEAQRVIEEWNTLESLGVAPVNTISKESRRYKMLCSRIKEHGEEKVLDAICRIRASDFLLGRKTDFTITFDWFVKPNNFAKVADGNYSNKVRSGTTAEENRQAFYDKWRDV